MRTVLWGSAGRVSFILVAAGMVGSATLPAVSFAAAPSDSAVVNQPGSGRDGDADSMRVEIGEAVKYVREPDGTVHRVR